MCAFGFHGLDLCFEDGGGVLVVILDDFGVGGFVLCILVLDDLVKVFYVSVETSLEKSLTQFFDTRGRLVRDRQLLLSRCARAKTYT